MIFLLIIFNIFYLLIKGQNSLPNQCFLTFDNRSIVSNIIDCPSTCFTNEYLTNYYQYPIYGNETYSGVEISIEYLSNKKSFSFLFYCEKNSLICKSAIHDGRIAPWIQLNSSITFIKSANPSSTYLTSLRNGILSSKSTSIQMNSYSFQTNRINESSILDIAIEHRGYLYSSNSSSSITCRGSSQQMTIEPIEIDQGWKIWNENPLKYFTYPLKMSRNQALTFCQNNNGTLFYLNNSTELNIIENELITTVSQLFHSEISSSSNDILLFYIGLKQINRIKHWQDNIINFDETINSLKVNVTLNENEDYCTIIQSSSSNRQLFQIVTHKCDSNTNNSYPLCRLKPSISSEETKMIYRLENDNQSGNLTGVSNYCYQLGGYPIYAYNAYEWHLIQEIMLKDRDFNRDYVYTGLLSESQQENQSYWIPTNISYNSSLSYIKFVDSRGPYRYGYHLSRTPGESYYKLYDIDPRTELNDLRFCRKDNLKIFLTDSSNCLSKECETSSCLNKTLPKQRDNLKYSFYGCLPKNSLSSIVYTHSFPLLGDLTISSSINSSVSLRENSNENLFFLFNQTDKDLNVDCYQYLNMDRKQSSQLICDRSISINKTIQNINIPNHFNGLVSIGFKDRLISSYHFRFIHYQSNSLECNSQGISHPSINQCICYPGFYGEKCQYSCPTGYYGQSCTYECQGDDENCKGLLICLPDPYGCSCYSGWYGIKCDLMCPNDRYGPNCLNKCSCNRCNRFTGVCNCEGSECYSGPISRKSLESLCKSSSNLVVLIVVPIVSIIIVIIIIGSLLYWKKKRSSDEENLFGNADQQFSKDYPNDDIIISERL